MTDAPKTIAEPWRSVTFRYTNWRGETATRRAVPSEIFWSATEHHPNAQWIMRALDLDKNAPRDFALKDCDFRPLPADDAEMVGRVARALCCTEKKGANCRVANCAAKNAIYMIMALSALSAMRGEP